MNELFSLAGKVAIVTGASRGLGRAIATGLAEAGASIVAADILDPSEMVEELTRLGRQALGLRVDVTKRADVEAMVRRAVEKLGRVDILVNNAGIFRTAAAEDLAEEDWDRVIEVNLKGQFLCAREAGQQMMKQQSGVIINVASVAGILAFAQSAAYNASKAGIILLTKTLAVEWGKHNIRVNAICPGLFHTAMTQDLADTEEFRGMVKARVPLGRGGQPEELMGTVIYLASEASRYMTGHALVVDGGWTAGL